MAVNNKVYLKHIKHVLKQNFRDPNTIRSLKSDRYKIHQMLKVMKINLIRCPDAKSRASMIRALHGWHKILDQINSKLDKESNKL